jgi:hypothetical protein
LSIFSIRYFYILKRIGFGQYGAVKKYKELVKKVSAKEKQLQKEVTMVVTKFKKTAGEVEKNYK